MLSDIIFITGAPGSGKSTVARRLAEHYPKSLHLQVDHLREMMVNGLALPDGTAWNDEVNRQFQWARASASGMAEVYARAGVVVVIDDVCVPAEFADHYQALFRDPAVQRVLLLPSAADVIARIKQRGGPYDQFLVELVPWFYSFLEPMPKAGWHVIDSSGWTIDQTVQGVLAHLGPQPDPDSAVNSNAV